MAQADSKNSITAPVDTTRRRFLAVAAAGSIVGAGSLAAAAMAPNVPAAVTVPPAPAIAGPATLHDPVFGLIEAHRKAEVRWAASLQELERLEKAGVNGSDVDEQPCHDASKAFDAVVIVGATTLPGILAKLAYLQNIAEHDAWMLNRKGSAIRLIEGFAASIASVWAVQS
jgi:hypothetical protein